MDRFYKEREIYKEKRDTERSGKRMGIRKR